MKRLFQRDGCTHKGATEVGLIGTGRVLAGGRKEVAGRLYGSRLVISLIGPCGLPDSNLHSVADFKWINWADGGAPTLSIMDWRRLVRAIALVDGDVLIYCMGGHGRTGTALAILFYLSGATRGDPVEWIRERYCQEAVETRAQTNYLNRLGIETRCKGSDSMSGGGASRQAWTKNGEPRRHWPH